MINWQRCAASSTITRNLETTRRCQILDDDLQKEMWKFINEDKCEKIEEVLSEIFKLNNP